MDFEAASLANLSVGNRERPPTGIHTYPVRYEAIDPNSFFQDRPGALYVHVPFCTKKCHFCDFAVTTVHDETLRARYVEAVCREIAVARERLPVPRSTFEALYIGGGTPGLLTPGELGRILATLRATFDVAPGAEISVEFDPSSVTRAKLRQLIGFGYNRFSVGVQSFDDEVLRSANRAHNAAVAVESLEILIEESDQVGATVNLDLIFPLPGLTHVGWLNGVQKAIDLLTWLKLVRICGAAVDDGEGAAEVVG